MNAAPEPRDRQIRIGYLASHYPAISHTFVLREIQALRRRGVQVETFSIHRAPPSQLLAAADREEAQRTYALLPVRPAELVASHLLAALRSPKRYLETLAYALRRANPGLRGRLWGFFFFAETMPVWQAARRRGIRHLHAVFGDVASDVALLSTRFGGPGWSWSLAIHGPLEFYNVKSSALAEKLSAARFAIAVSDFGRSQLMAVGDEHRWQDIHVVRCGLEPEAFTVDGEGGPLRSEPPHILCVGRLIQIKGQAVLIEALGDLHRRGIAARLTIVGEGPQRSELERLAQRLRIAEAVTFAGAVGQDHIQSLYRSADVFCLPSMAEGLPVVFMEAMALRVPVVATRIMGVPELVEDGRTGLLVAPGRADLLADALARVLVDPDLRARLGSQGREKVLAEFDVNNSARRLEEIFRATIGTSR